MTAASTVYVVDDDNAVRESLDMLVRSIGLPVKTFSTARDFLGAYKPASPGCLVLDVRMPGMSGLELQRHLRDNGEFLPVIIITGHGDVPIALRAMKDGAMEFLEKPFSKQLLLEQIRDAISRDEQHRRETASLMQIKARMATLTDREHEVMNLIVDGKASKEAAAALGISKKTVDVHRARVMRKLQADSLAKLVEMVLMARKADLN